MSRLMGEGKCPVRFFVLIGGDRAMRKTWADHNRAVRLHLGIDLSNWFSSESESVEISRARSVAQKY